MVESEPEVQFCFKVIIVGNSSVGKTSAFEQFCNSKFHENQPPSLVPKFYEKAIPIPNSFESIDLMLWDTPGRESLHLLSEETYQNANICAVMYSFVDRKSFEAIPEWIEKVKQINKNVQIILVENKIDLLENGVVGFDEAERMANQLEAPLFRISVKENLNIKPLFDFLATVLNQKFLSSMTSLPRGADSFFITTPDNPKPPASTPVTEPPSPNETKEESGYCNII